MRIAVSAMMIGLAVLAGCSREAPMAAAAPVDPAGDVSASVTARESGGAGCIDSFVQVYEEAAAQEPPPPPPGLCYVGAPADGAPRYPSTTRKVRLEYDRGDYFAVEDTAHWEIGDEPDLARNCMVAKLVNTRVTLRVRGGQRESARTRDGVTERSATTGEQYGSSIALGGGPTALPTIAGSVEPVREESPYGTCLRAQTANSSLCTLEQPRDCKSGQVMLPIELRFPAAPSGMQLGRTTSLERSAVDPRAWVLP